MNKKILLILLLIVFANPVFSQIYRRGDETSAAIKDTDQLKIDKPAALQTGDIMIVTIAQKESDDKSSDNNPFSSGWTLVAGADIEGKGKHAWGAVLYRIATADDNSIMSYTFTLSDSKEAVGAIVAFSGVDISNPFDVAPGSISVGKDSMASTPAITTVSPNAAVLMLAMSKKDISWFNWKTTDPDNITELYDFQGDKDTSVGAAGAIKSDAGSTGEGTVELGDKEESYGVILVALRPYCNLMASDITQPTCVVATGSVVLSGLPSSGTITQTGSTAANYMITGTTMTIPGLAAGSYKFSVWDSYCSAATENVVINPLGTNTWTGSWNNGVPTIDQKIVFSADYSLDADVSGCSCKVTARKNVIIKSGRTMKIVNEVIVEGAGAGAGTLTFENNASLVQINDDAINKGSIIYERTTGAILNTDYVYWSTPVADAKLEAIQTGTLYYSFNASGNSWVRQSASSVMLDGIGYIVRGAGTGLGNGTPFNKTATFIGKPNNGVNDVIISANKFNLIGNPYPSAIDADALIIKNEDILSGSLYFWTHKSAIQLATNITNGTAGSGAYAYTSDDYATYNLTGGTSTSTKADSDPNGTTAPSGKIAAGQAFFAAGSSAGGTARFENSMRVPGGVEGVDNSQFFKLKSNLKQETKIDKNRVWLNLTNAEGAFKQTLIGYITGATNDYESAYDAVSISGNKYINFYSLQNNSNYVIQGRALPFDDNDTVPLGYKTTIAGEFKIGIDQVDGFLVNKKIYIEDKLLGKVQDLSESPYAFTTEIGTFNSRFVLSYANKTLEVTDFEITLESQVVVSNKNKQLIITSTADAIDKVIIFDATARKVYEKTNTDSQELKILDLISSHQLLFVKVVLRNGKSITKKIIY
jgi:hypothetical protein